MPTNVSITWSSKRPASTPYSSDQASVTIAIELALGADVASEAGKLYRQAEEIVGQQLALRPIAPPQNAPPSSSLSAAPVTAAPSRPSGPRGGAAPISDSQRRLIAKLLVGRTQDLETHLRHHAVAAIDQLTIRQASTVIDALKSPT